jgi:hypothetical protein
MPRVLNFYMDDSGTRMPNRKPLPYRPEVREFFALGGVLINEEDEGPARKLYDDFLCPMDDKLPVAFGRDTPQQEKFQLAQS